MATTKLDRLNALNSALLLCKQDCAKDSDEWQFYDGIMAQVKNLIAEEQHRLGYQGVYPIVDGQATTAIFYGTPEQCDIYVSTLLEGHPEMKGNIIIANV